MDFSFKTYTLLKGLDDHWQRYLTYVDDWDIEFFIHKINSQMFHNTRTDMAKFRDVLVKMPKNGLMISDIANLCDVDVEKILGILRTGSLDGMIHVYPMTTLFKWYHIVSVMYSIDLYEAKVVLEVFFRFWGAVSEHCEDLAESINKGHIHLKCKT